MMASRWGDNNGKGFSYTFNNDYSYNVGTPTSYWYGGPVVRDEGSEASMDGSCIPPLTRLHYDSPTTSMTYLGGIDESAEKLGELVIGQGHHRSVLVEIREHLRDRNATELEHVLNTPEGIEAANELEEHERRALWQLALLDTSTLFATWLLHVVIRAVPDGLMEPVLINQPHSLPISLALDKQEMIPKAVLESMIECAPQSAEQIIFPDGGGYLLHKATKRKAHHELLQKIYHAYPYALRTVDNSKDGNLPIHLFLLANGVSHSKRKRTVQFFLNEYPDSATSPNKSGKTPLHLAMEKVTLPLDIFRIVLRYYSQSMINKRTECNTKNVGQGVARLLNHDQTSTALSSPLAWSCQLWDDSTSSRTLQLASSKLTVVLRAHPEMVLMRDSCGKIPFQRIKSDMIRQSLVEDILTTDIGQKISSQRDNEGNTILHLLSSFVPETDSETYDQSKSVTSRCKSRDKDTNKDAILCLQNSIFLRAFATKDFSFLAQITNNNGELPLHVRLKRQPVSSLTNTNQVHNAIYEDIESLLRGFPQGAATVDPITRLYPFMQAASASVGQHKSKERKIDEGADATDTTSVGTIYMLLQRLLCYQSMEGFFHNSKLQM